MIGYMFAKDTLPPFTELDVRLVCLTPGCDNEYAAPAGWTESYPHDLSAMVRETAGAREGWTVDEYGIDRCPDHGTGKAPYSAYPQGHPLAREDAEPLPAAVTHPDGIVIPIPEVPSGDDAASGSEGQDVRPGRRRRGKRDAQFREAGALTIPPHRGKHRGKPKREEKAQKPARPPKAEREPLLARLGLISREPFDLPDDNAPDTNDPGEWMKPFPRDDTRATWEMRSSWIRRGWLRKRRAKPKTDDNNDATGVAA